MATVSAFFTQSTAEKYCLDLDTVKPIKQKLKVPVIDQQ